MIGAEPGEPGHPGAGIPFVTLAGVASRLATRSLSLSLLVAFGCSAGPDDGGLDALGKADEENEFDMVGRIDVDMAIDHTTVPGKVSVTSLFSEGTAPFNVRVESETGEIVLELHGPLDGDTGKFDPLHERSQLVEGAGAHVFGFAPPESGFYIALVRDARDRAVPFTLQYTSAEAERFKFDLGDRIQGMRSKTKDETEARASWQSACDRWRKMILRLSLADTQLVDCGTPDFDDDEGQVESRGQGRIALPAGIAEVVSTDDDQGEVTATSAVDYLDRCDERLTAAKERLGDRMVSGACGFKSAVHLVVLGNESETITAHPELFLTP